MSAVRNHTESPVKLRRSTRWRATSWKGTWPHLILLPVLILWSVPLVMVVGLSLLPTNNPRTTWFNLVPETPALSNYGEIWSQNPILQHIINSVVITVPTVVLVVVFGSMAAFAFAKLNIPLEGAWFLVLLMALVLPIPSIVVAVFQILQTIGLYNTRTGLVLVYTAIGIPFATIIFRTGFAAIPHELFQAAQVDGARIWTIYRKIYLPLAKPMAAVVVIWQFMMTWNEFLLPLVSLNDNALKPLTLVPLAYQGIYLSQPGALFAILVLISLPVVLVFLATQRFLVEGLSGAVK